MAKTNHVCRSIPAPLQVSNTVLSAERDKPRQLTTTDPPNTTSHAFVSLFLCSSAHSSIHMLPFHAHEVRTHTHTHTHARIRIPFRPSEHKTRGVAQGGGSWAVLDQAS